MMHFTKKTILTAVLAVLLVGAIVALAITFPLIQMKLNALKHNFTPLTLTERGDRIYFLNTRSADAILLESGGKYALIDAAEDSDNPRGLPGLEYEGTEEYVLECVKKIAGNAQGKVTLEFVAGTHSHSDHIGGFDTVILDEDVTVKQAYLKEYDETLITDYEIKEWDNKEVYEQMMGACEARAVPVEHNLSAEPFALGNFTVSFYNTEKPATGNPVGENENSIGVLVEKAGKRAFLAGDINNYDGDEDRLAKELGKIDLLKVAHHGYGGSTSKGYAKALAPEIAIITNTIHGLNKKPLRALNAAGASIYATKEHQGIVAEFSESGIKLYENIDGVVEAK